VQRGGTKKRKGPEKGLQGPITTRLLFKKESSSKKSSRGRPKQKRVPGRLFRPEPTPVKKNQMLQEKKEHHRIHILRFSPGKKRKGKSVLRAAFRKNRPPPPGRVNVVEVLGLNNRNKKEKKKERTQQRLHARLLEDQLARARTKRAW